MELDIISDIDCQSLLQLRLPLQHLSLNLHKRNRSSEGTRDVVRLCRFLKKEGKMPEHVTKLLDLADENNPYGHSLSRKKAQIAER